MAVFVPKVETHHIKRYPRYHKADCSMVRHYPKSYKQVASPPSKSASGNDYEPCGRCGGA